MGCHHPLTAFKAGGTIRFKKPEPGTFSEYAELQLSCRQCLGCRIDRENEWSVRLMHEASMHEPHTNHFITLTYNDQNLPWDNSLDHSHFQKFIRSLRKKTGAKLRFFVAGEYGEQESRPHYHAVIFGLELKDLRQVGKRSYRSKFLEETWGKGIVDIGDKVTKAACRYIAGYMLKDSTGQWKVDWQWPNRITGEMMPRQKPYARMSTRPGIAKQWFEKYKTDVFPNDYVVMEGKKVATPAYYRRMLKEVDPDCFAKVMQQRLVAIESEDFEYNNTRERLRAREALAEHKAGKRLSRSAQKKGKN